jgi:hypothetical protein
MIEPPDFNPEEIRGRLVELREEHRDLDDAITSLTQSLTYNHLQLQRLKKRKLQLKDQILQLEGLLLPDIIA